MSKIFKALHDDGRKTLFEAQDTQVAVRSYDAQGELQSEQSFSYEDDFEAEMEVEGKFYELLEEEGWQDGQVSRSLINPEGSIAELHLHDNGIELRRFDGEGEPLESEYEEANELEAAKGLFAAKLKQMSAEGWLLSKDKNYRFQWPEVEIVSGSKNLAEEYLLLEIVCRAEGWYPGGNAECWTIGMNILLGKEVRMSARAHAKGDTDHFIYHETEFSVPELRGEILRESILKYSNSHSDGVFTVEADSNSDEQDPERSLWSSIDISISRPGAAQALLRFRQSEGKQDLSNSGQAFRDSIFAALGAEVGDLAQFIFERRDVFTRSFFAALGKNDQTHNYDPDAVVPMQLPSQLEAFRGPLAR